MGTGADCFGFNVEFCGTPVGLDGTLEAELDDMRQSSASVIFVAWLKFSLLKIGLAEPELWITSFLQISRIWAASESILV